MLYTVRPLEKIYATPPGFEADNKMKQKADAEAEYREVMLSHGRVITRRSGENYVVDRINSTDMSDYLNDEYAPGKII
jgi:hypothetical protein